MIHRRSLLTGLAATLITAPAIVRATSIMPVRSPTDLLAEKIIKQYAEWKAATAYRAGETVLHNGMIWRIIGPQTIEATPLAWLPLDEQVRLTSSARAPH